ncbi:MAG: hypothetical protein JWP74_3418 [Marmoricola sp.]|nr:hypothetical protein [Marmoricola sp.]
MDYLELRVHGVHGTSPASMLGITDDEVGQVAGDGLTGFYRAREGVALPLRTLRTVDGSADRVSVEAHSWGSLTSGVKGAVGWLKRVGWLLLLPFALANLAYWARLEVGKDSARARWGARAVRLSGLVLTVFMVLTPCVVFIDMVGWQCFRAGVPRCSHLPGQLDFLADRTPTERLLLTSLVPMLVVCLLWLLSRQTVSSYEAVTGSDPVDRASGPTDRSLPVFARPSMWSAVERTQRLQALHVAAAVAAITLFVGAHVRHNRLAGMTPMLESSAILLCIVLASVVLAACVLMVCVFHASDLEHTASAGMSRLGGWLGNSLGAARGLAFTALALFAVQSLALLRYRSPLDETTDYHGHNVWFIALFVLLTVLHLSVFTGERMSGRALACVVAASVLVGGGFALLAHLQGWHQRAVLTGTGVLVIGGLVLLQLWHYRWSGARPGAAWHGAGASVLLAAAAWVGLLFTASAVIASANYLNGPDRSVADLVTHVNLRSDPVVKEYRASGDVTISKAVYRLSGNRLTVFRGTVTAGRFTKEIFGSDVAHRVGVTRLSSRTTLIVPGGQVAIEQSCQVQGATVPSRCGPDSATYEEADQLDLGQLDVTLADPSGRVTLAPQSTIETAIVVPQVLVWTPLGQFAWLIAVALALAIASGVYARGAGSSIRRTLLGGGPGSDQAIPATDRIACAGARSRAGLAHRAERILDLLGAVTAPIAIGIVVLSANGKPPWDLAGWTRGLATLSMYLTVLAAAGLVLLGSYIRRSESARKAVGVIWDLTTFWPRAAHPLAPPCYAERVVPELDTRTRWALEADPDNVVILSGHSQGSLIVAAMTSRLDERHLSRVRVITYGSQIRALYGRVFPAVAGPDAIGYVPTPGPATLGNGFPDVGGGSGMPVFPPYPESLRERLAGAGGSWVNLFRRSDPLGFRVFSDDDSPIDRPVPEVPSYERGDPDPVVRGHSDYQHTPEYRETVCGWSGEVVFESTYDEAGVADVPVLPY